MERYIAQLIEDLEKAAKNPPAPVYFETPPHLAEAPDIAELALVPFKTIEEWTGIKQEVFPDVGQLEVGQWERVNEAIFKVLDSLNIKLIDVPNDIPPEMLYEVLTTNWDEPVQYLPSTGMDLELCSGDPETCPYGDYCDCGEPFDELELPHRFNVLIPQIAQNIDAGLVCFLNPETLEMEDIPQKMWNDPDEFYALTGVSAKNEPYKHDSWDDYWTFEPLESLEAFRIMENFAGNMPDKRFREKLFVTLNRHNPFSHFKTLIDGSKYRDDWFRFKLEQLEMHVKQELFDKINEYPWTGDFPGDINGFYNDDGTKINPESVPVPGLCIICRKYQTDDWEENMLCTLNRNDQRDEPDFKCGAFEKI